MNPVTSPYLSDVPPGSFTLADGRKLGYRDFGAAGGRPFLYFSGGGSSSIEPAYAHKLCRQLGLRVIGIDRPGMARSDHRNDYSLGGVVKDSVALADHLELARFGSIGMSAGGPFAVMIAQSAPDRIPMTGLINAGPDRTMPEWKAVPLPIRLKLAVMLSRPMRKLAFSSISNAPEKRVAAAARKSNLSQQDQDHIVAAIREGSSNPHGFETLMREIELVLTQPWPVRWPTLRARVFAYSATHDPSLRFYQALAARYSGVTTVEIPGTHAPVVNDEVWHDLARHANALL